MKTIKRILPLLLSIMMLVTAFAVTASAADGATNISMEISATEVNVGDTFTIAVSYEAMKVASFACQLKYDGELVEYVSALPCDPEFPDEFVLCTRRGVTPGTISTPEEAKAVNQIGFVVVSPTEASYVACDIYVATFTAKKAGTVEFTLVEDSSGTDGYKDTAATQTVTIKSVEPACEHTSTKAVPNNDGTHNVVCANTECGEIVTPNVTCTGSDDGDCTTAVTCECGYVVTAAKDAHVAGDDDGDCTTAVKCANCDQIATAANEKHTGGTATCSKQAECSVCGMAYGELNSENHAYGEAVTGWYEINGDWYYGDKKVCGNNGEHIDHTPKTGVVRVPYPTVAINGVTYAPNQEDIDYAASKGKTFIDEESALFIFGNDGKFKYNVTGFGPHISGAEGVYSYAVNGMIPWHYGLAELDGDYYYFKGDETNGGNIMATGRIYATRNTTDLDIVIGGVYMFGTDGKMTQNDGIVNIEGTLYYYEDGRLAIDAGLIKVGDDYYYVRSTGEKAGQLVVGREYWVSDTNDLLAAGMYEFDENGKVVIDPTRNANGIVEIDGVYYYYVGGVKQVGAGVVELTDEEGVTFYIYVRSDGTLATGEYWPTTTNGLLERGCYDWCTDGKYYPAN